MTYPVKKADLFTPDRPKACRLRPPVGALRVGFVVLLTFFAFMGHAQKKQHRTAGNGDSLVLLREFMLVANRYQRQPLYLELEVKQATNYQTSEEDTLRAQARFYLTPEASYIRYGDMEQLVNDSVALMVSDSLQRMILFTDARPVKERMGALAGQLMKDSSIAAWSNRYRARQVPSDSGAAALEVVSRSAVPGTSLPRETITIFYDPLTKTPQQILARRRSLIAVGEAVYTELSSRPEWKTKLLAPEGKGYYLVKEQVSTFYYRAVRHQAPLNIPASVGDRVYRNEQGEWAPAKGFETYLISIH